MPDDQDWQKKLLNFMQHYQQTQESSWEEVCNIRQIYQNWAEQIQIDPAKLTDMQKSFF